MVKITHLLDKLPAQCSGGESQRVAVARTLITNPGAFLLDEPLSSLDAKLRREMRAEVDRLHKELKKTFIYPKYFHENEMLWEKMNACWTVNNYQELEEAIYKIKSDHNYRAYSQEDVDKFIEYVVYNGNRDRDVLGDYKDFIVSSNH